MNLTHLKCFLRPFSRHTLDEALAGIAAAGYSHAGILGGCADLSMDLSLLDDAGAQRVRDAARSHGLTIGMGCLAVRHDTDEAAAFAHLDAQIAGAARLGVASVMTFGADHPEQYARWWRAAAHAAAAAEAVGIGLVFKPHGGCTGDGADLRRCLDEIAHPNATIWYDAGNIIHYTDKDPVEELASIAGHVSGFCAKDCGQHRGDVMLQFGEGRVDFAAVLGALARSGARGPIYVECCRPGTSEEVVASVASNREFLERTLASLG